MNLVDRFLHYVSFDTQSDELTNLTHCLTSVSRGITPDQHKSSIICKVNFLY